jgi:capsular exopolysaccharide synthesis family protein
MQRPNPGDPFLPAPAPNGHPMTGGFGAPPQTGGFPGQFPASPFAVANPTAPGTGRRSLPTIAELFHSFKRRWVLVLMVGGLLGTMFAAGVWMALPSGKHQARALIQMHAESPNLVSRGGGDYRESEFDRFKQSELATMKTKGFLTTVAGHEAVSRQPLIQMAEDKARAIEGLMSIKEESSEILSVMMNGDDAAQLKAILTGFVETYLNQARDAQQEERKRSLEEIKAKLEKAEKQVAVEREKLVKNAKEKGAALNESGVREMFLQQGILSLGQKLEQFTEEQTKLRLQLAQLKAEGRTGMYVVDMERVTAALVDHPKLADAQEKVDRSRADLAAFAKALLPGAPRLAEAEQQLAAAQRTLDRQRKELADATVAELKAARRDSLSTDIGKLEGSLEIVTGQIVDTEKRKGQLEDNARKAVEGGVDQFNVKNDLKPLVDQRDRLSTQMMQLELEEGNRKLRVELKEGAQVYLNYNLKQKMVLAAGAGVVGLLGVMLLISYLEWRNRRVDGVDQVVSELGMRVIGTIPAFPSRASLRSGDAGQNQNWRFILNESVNSTRTMLLHTAKTQQMQVIMVTSAMQGEGKTSLSSQLATSMATAGLRTLILDFDLRNPSMQKLFDVQVAPGCCEVLLQEVDVSDCVQPTTVPNLWIIPAGQCNHRVIAALAQGHPLEQLFNRLRGQFDIIVVDSCPILPVADSLLVAQHVDGVVFSILQDVSQLPKVMDASERLVQLNIALLGAVVNGIKPDIQAYGYNYVKQLPA